MESEVPNPKPKTLEDICTPIFDRDMGQRMRLIRMKRLMDQAQLGEKLGVHQTTISDLELGRFPVPKRPFSITQIKEVFKEDTAFILFGRNPDRFSQANISGQFWFTKLVIERDRTTPQGGENHWTRRFPNKPRRRS